MENFILYAVGRHKDVYIKSDMIVAAVLRKYKQSKAIISNARLKLANN